MLMEVEHCQMCEQDLRSSRYYMRNFSQDVCISMILYMVQEAPDEDPSNYQTRLFVA